MLIFPSGFSLSFGGLFCQSRSALTKLQRLVNLVEENYFNLQMLSQDLRNKNKHFVRHLAHLIFEMRPVAHQIKTFALSTVSKILPILVEHFAVWF